MSDSGAIARSVVGAHAVVVLTGIAAAASVITNIGGLRDAIRRILASPRIRTSVPCRPALRP